VRLAALCGLLRCEIAEDPKGNRRRRFGRDIGRGSSRREAPKVAATGLYRGKESGFWAGRQH
jgi:hypothetical protein